MNVQQAHSPDASSRADGSRHSIWDVVVFQVKKNAGPNFGDPAYGLWSFSRKKLLAYLKESRNARQLFG